MNARSAAGILAELEWRIEQGELSSGDELQAPALAAEFAVSKPKAYAAIDILATNDWSGALS